MDALSEAIRRLLKRQEENERRLDAIEKALRIAEPAPPPVPPPLPAQPAPRAEPPPQTEPPPVEAAPPPLPPMDAPVEPPPSAPRRLETTVGLAWVNRIGAVTLTLCVAFIF